MGAFAAIGIGAPFGAWLRWGLSVARQPAYPTVPLGTVTANLCGGLLMGVVAIHVAGSLLLAAAGIAVAQPVHRRALQ